MKAKINDYLLWGGILEYVRLGGRMGIYCVMEKESESNNTQQYQI